MCTYPHNSVYGVLIFGGAPARARPSVGEGSAGEGASTGAGAGVRACAAAGDPLDRSQGGVELAGGAADFPVTGAA